MRQDTGAASAAGILQLCYCHYLGVWVCGCSWMHMGTVQAVQEVRAMADLDSRCCRSLAAVSLPLSVCVGVFIGAHGHSPGGLGGTRDHALG